MKHSFLVSVLLLLAIFIQPQQVLAKEQIAGTSARLVPIVVTKVSDERVEKLESYLKKYKSPLASEAQVFVREADKYGHDYRFVAAIAGLESGFGKRIPLNSNNAWGWGVYGTNVMRFTTWEEGIQTISRDLRVKYIEKWGADNIYEIGKIYAASPTWAERVLGFMDAIERHEVKSKKEMLSISI